MIYAQDGYTNLDRNVLGESLQSNQGEINILLVARTTIDYPIQEIRSHANQKKIQECQLLVMNQ
ncbi:hypothetical protein KKG31_06385 [Patescibacteria group bacterium]|nr:hypothetical protein [Patescibacteria group bacterium]MBU1758723.1 hypothetical protein [Patescibacteria group bacterium]